MCFYVFCLILLSWSLCPKSQKSQQNLQNHPRRKQRVQKQRKTPPANTSLICLTYAAKFAQVNLDTRCNQASEHFSQGFCFQCFFFLFTKVVWWPQQRKHPPKWSKWQLQLSEGSPLKQRRPKPRHHLQKKMNYPSMFWRRA